MNKQIKWKKLTALVMAFVLLCSIWPAQEQAKTVKMGNTFENQLLGSGSVEYKNRIYYGLTSKLYSVKKDGTDKKFVCEPEAGANGFCEVAVYGGYLYATFDFYGGSDSSDCHLLKISLNGKSMKDLGRVNEFTIVNGTIYCTKTKHIPATQDAEGYFTSSYNKVLGIYSMNLSGGNSKKLMSGDLMRLYGSDGKKLYYDKYNYNTGNTTVYTSDMKGKNKKKIKTDSAMSSVFFSQGSLYYKKDVSKGYAIYRVSMKTGAAKKIYTASDWFSNFSVEGNYLLVPSKKGLLKVNLRTGKKVTLNKQVKSVIRGIHGSVLVGERYRMDEKAGTDYDVLLIKKSGKTLKKIGAYFVS